MFLRSFMICLMAMWAILQCGAAKEYQFIPARCVDHPGVEQQIGGPLSLCSFPPKYQTADAEDIQAVIKHIKSLNLN
ncbi:uncharacterized protein Dwil_GK14721 [Drosophila willistoni]|uniref:Uncharacterized protein n=1 Tax=Drosophila willistoni TaxID=7260 RepID=B4MUX5_DROWI|nr:uncharacterized protein LOC6642375 [Drosophila willistoni]EDW76320.1 uncharacterized protein Dwil_GK14721 [Drosophila willistoni]